MNVARIKPEGFLVFSADTGLCATGFSGEPESLRNRGAGTPANDGNRTAAIIKGHKDADAGKVLGEHGVCPWRKRWRSHFSKRHEEN